METEKNILTQSLKIEEQKIILAQMFGFDVINESIVDGAFHNVIYDEAGDEFYGSDENLKYDLSTIEGIIRYAQDQSEEYGYMKCQRDFRRLLRIE